MINMGQLLLIFLSINVALSKATDRKPGKAWIYIQPGTSATFQKSSYFGTNQYEYGSLYTDPTYTLKITCSVRLTCNDGGYVKVLDKDNVMVGWYCSSSAAYANTPVMSSLYYLSIELFGGSSYSYTPDYSCQVSSTSTTAPTTTKLPVSTSCRCGTTGGGRIVGGAPVGKGAIPWQVGLGSRVSNPFNVFCGGTLISPKYVVSASHCIKNSDTGVKIFLGDIDLRSSTSIVAGLLKIQQHESYNPTTYNNDIALITLDRSMTLSANVFPACLPRKYTSETFSGRTLRVSGWGTMTEGSSSSPSTLQAVTVQGITNAQCSRSYNQITNGMLCATSPGKDSCQGDSGGPLTYTESSVTYLVGVVSFGTGCARIGYPGVYARVTSYLSWLDGKTDTPLCSK